MRIGGDIDDEEIKATLAYKDHPNKAITSNHDDSILLETCLIGPVRHLNRTNVKSDSI